MKNKSFVKAIGFCIVLLLVIPTFSFAATDFSKMELSPFSKSELRFIAENEISDEQISELGTEGIQGLMVEAQANGFSKEIVQNYIGAMENYVEPEAMNGTLSNDGTYWIYENGSTLPDLTRRSIPSSGQLQQSSSDSDLSVMSYTGGVRSVINSGDQSGVYYAVKSDTGYTQATAFVTLPALASVSANDRPYMFLAANSFAQGNSQTMIGDYGVVYMPSDGKWHPFINLKQWNDATASYQDIINTVYSAVPAGSTALYLNLKITNGTSSDSIAFSVLDKTCSVSYLSYTKTLDRNPVQPNQTNLNIYHETTLAQLFKSGQVKLIPNTGTTMKNAKFSLAYLYKGTTPYKWETGVTSDAYKQAPSSNTLNCVTVNSDTTLYKWYQDDITIIFNKTL